MKSLRAQCDFGPRVPGTTAHKRCLEYFVGELRKIGYEPILQRFTARTLILKNKPVAMTNIIVRLNPEAERSALISAHWDTRCIAELDPNPNARLSPIAGANDGASGVAATLELARIFADRPTSYGLVFALFDGEDMGGPDAPEDWCLGSKEMARSLDPSWGVRLAINLDMIADRYLAFTRELYCAGACPEFADFCWGIGQEIAPKCFDGKGGENFIFDDHMPFLRLGIPSFNLIDFKYPQWHTLGDTPGRCSAESLGSSGRVVEAILRRLEHVPWDFNVGALAPSQEIY